MGDQERIYVLLDEIYTLDDLIEQNFDPGARNILTRERDRRQEEFDAITGADLDPFSESSYPEELHYFGRSYDQVVGRYYTDTYGRAEPAMTPMPNIPGSGVGSGGIDDDEIDDSDISGDEHGVEKKVKKGGGTLFDFPPRVKELAKSGSGKVAKYDYKGSQLSAVAEQEVRAQLGISSDFNKEYRIIQALQSPTDYLAEKLAHRAEIDDEAMQTFQRTLKQFKQLDMTDDDAIAKAKAAALEVRNRLEQVHSKRFPTDATSTAKRRSERMN